MTKRKNFNNETGLAPESTFDQRDSQEKNENSWSSTEEGRQRLVKKVMQMFSDPNRSGDPDWINYRIRLIRCLEKMLKTKFKSSGDFRDAIGAYLKGYDARKRPLPERIRKTRKKLKWTQTQLAHHLGYSSPAAIAQFEKGKRKPSRRVLEWLEKTEI